MSCLILVVYSLRVAQVGVEITVGDVQDNCPLLTVNPLSVSVNEGRPAVDTNIGISISAEDRDSTSAQNTITLSLNGGSNPHFGIVTDTSTAGSVVSVCGCGCGCGCGCVCVLVCLCLCVLSVYVQVCVSVYMQVWVSVYMHMWSVYMCVDKGRCDVLVYVYFLRSSYVPCAQTAHIDQLASGTPLDHETLNVHHLTITASDGQCSVSPTVILTQVPLSTGDHILVTPSLPAACRIPSW